MVGWGLTLSTLAALAFIVWFIVKKCDKVERERMMLAMVLIFGAVVFFTLFEQAGTSLNLFASRNVDLAITSQATSFLGLPMAAPTSARRRGHPARQLGHGSTRASGGPDPVVQRRLHPDLRADLRGDVDLLGKRGKVLDPTFTFGLGLIQVGLGFLVVVWRRASGMVDSAYRHVPLIMLGMLYLLHTTGELFLSPVGQWRSIPSSPSPPSSRS